VPRTLFIVASDREDLVRHLAQEFPGGEVSVVQDRRHSDRRHGERRRLTRATVPERRLLERRARQRLESQLRSAGYMIVQLEDGPRTRPSGRSGNATAIRQVATYLRDRFRYHTTVVTHTPGYDGQAFVLVNRAGRPVHRLVFTREFLDYYGINAPDRIPAVLDEWKLPHQIEATGGARLVVAEYGLRSA
jgi:hypothetical protein